MSFSVKTAERRNVKVKIAMQGPSGSGKTLSALMIAKGLAKGDISKVLVIDTENESSLYYADRQDLTGWKHIAFAPPYDPRRYIEAITFAESMSDIDVIVIDSISHEWDGKGGCLELQNSMKGNSFVNWGKITPLHNAFVDKLRDSSKHVIATMRSKQDYVIEENDRGKSAPKKVGLKSVQREGLDYEFGIVFEMNMSHHAEASKDRTGVFMPRGFFTPTEETGRDLLYWSESAALPIVEETYQALDPQKVILAKLCRDQLLVTEREVLLKISEVMLGTPMASLSDDLKTKVDLVKITEEMVK